MRDAMKLEAGRALRKARTSWAALRKQMAMPLPPHIPGFSDPREIRAGFLAQAVTSDGFLASYIARQLVEGN